MRFDWLYHGTSALRFASMQRERRLRIVGAPVAEDCICLTTVYEAARFWAEMAAWTDAHDFHSDGAGCILVLRRKALRRAKYTLTKIKYDPEFAWAKEFACWSDINLKQSGVLIEVQYIPDAAKITQWERLPTRVRTPHWAAPSLPIDELLEAARKLGCGQGAAEQSDREKGMAPRAVVLPPHLQAGNPPE
jgi:hypothetical protein